MEQGIGRSCQPSDGGWSTGVPQIFAASACIHIRSPRHSHSITDTPRMQLKNMAPSHSTIKRASLLGIPAELRLEIYAAAWPDLDAASFTVHGSLRDIPGQATHANYKDGPWALLQTCRIIAGELEEQIPAIEECHFTLTCLTDLELREWLTLLGDEQVARLRTFDLRGWGKCISKTFERFHYTARVRYLSTHMEMGDHECCAIEHEGRKLRLGS